ncbi:hypothetical protein YR28_17660 [Salmonella enterica subsp. enterica]|nr:hypothetical protein [Salmonella enterica subsp. enterica]
MWNDGFSWIADVSTAFFDTTLAFYDKSPIVASAGYIMICGSVPLHMLLKFAKDMKRLDNEKVKARFRHRLAMTRSKPVSGNVSDAEV